MIAIKNMSISAGGFTLCDVSLHVAPGEYAMLLGPTGSGKTTLLEVIAGLRIADAGRVLIGDCDVTQATPAARRVAYVPQDAAVFRHLTVAENLGFAQSIGRVDAALVLRDVEVIAIQLGLIDLLNRPASNLSGGEQQRVAIGRALLRRDAQALLLDEPTSALDGEMPQRVLELLREHSGDKCVLHVTHDDRLAQSPGVRSIRMSDLRGSERAAHREEIRK